MASTSIMQSAKAQSSTEPKTCWNDDCGKCVYGEFNAAMLGILAAEGSSRQQLLASLGPHHKLAAT